MVIDSILAQNIIGYTCIYLYYFKIKINYSFLIMLNYLEFSITTCDIIKYQ